MARVLVGPAVPERILLAKPGLAGSGRWLVGVGRSEYSRSAPGQLASRCWPGPTAFAPIVRSRAHIEAWLALTGYPSSCSTGVMTS